MIEAPRRSRTASRHLRPSHIVIPTNPHARIFLVALILSLALSAAFSSGRAPISSNNNNIMMKQDTVQLYHECVSHSVDLSQAHYDNTHLTFVRTCRDISNASKRKFLYQIKDKNTVLMNEMPSSIQYRMTQGNYVVIFRTGDASSKIDDEDGTAFIEVWNHPDDSSMMLVQRIELPSSKNIFFQDPTLGGPSWSQQETQNHLPRYIVYVAQAKKETKISSFFDQKDANSKKTIGEVYQDKIQWGEKYTNLKQLTELYVIDLQTGQVKLVPNVPKATIVGQPVLSPDLKSIIYVGWPISQNDKSLGMIYCQQRPSKLYQSDISHLFEEDNSLDKQYRCLTPDFRMAVSPAFIHDSTNLVYLASRQGYDTHSGCMELWKMSIDQDVNDESTHKLVIPTIYNPCESAYSNHILHGIPFPGIYTQKSPYPVRNTTTVLLNTQWGCCLKIIEVDVDTGNVRLLDCGGEDKTCSDLLLCVDSRSAIVQRTSYASDSQIVCVNLKQDSEEGPHILCSSFSPIAAAHGMPPLTKRSPATLRCMIETIQHLPGPSIPVQSILLMPPTDNVSKLIVVPHGGPHSASSTAFLPTYAFLCLSGYAVLLVNYRGSTGFGQESINSLPTQIGKLDVEDVVAATRDVLEKNPQLTRLGVCGGSHGGFLTAHLTSQYPTLFRAAALRNPVVNLPAMASTTDIPDWCFVEALGKYDVARPVSEEELKIMHEKSPIGRVDLVQVPTLVALGQKDLRVPYSQGLEWYHSLPKSVSKKLLLYEEDDHAIDHVESEADHWIHIQRWFDEHL